MPSTILRTPLAFQVTGASLKEHVWDIPRRQQQSSRISCELTAQLQRLGHDFPQEVIGDLIHSIPCLSEVNLLPTDL
ncbi:hypothetical protein TNCV_1305481 [Trichonephila clavipes]|nr:hypothetical protein TNCV_1305481 [Trichonephila clavipes]